MGLIRNCGRYFGNPVPSAQNPSQTGPPSPHPSSDPTQDWESGQAAWPPTPRVGGLILHESVHLSLCDLPQMRELPLPPHNIWMLLAGPEVQVGTSGCPGRGSTGWHRRRVFSKSCLSQSVWKTRKKGKKTLSVVM